MIYKLNRKCMEMISDSLLGNSYPYFCNCCRHKIKKFLPYGAKSDIYTRYHIVGGVESCTVPYMWFNRSMEMVLIYDTKTYGHFPE